MASFFFYKNEKGIVLIISIMFMALLSILAATAYVVSTRDSFISANYQYAEQAFNHAEAGVQYGLTKLEIAIKSGTSLPTSGSMPIPGASAPTGFSFTVSPLVVKGANSYSFTSTGIANRNASSQIKVGIKRMPAIFSGVFGDMALDSKPHVQYFSYDSGVIADPIPSDSTGKSVLASNGSIELGAGALVDGDVVLGNNYTADAAYHPSGAPVITGEQGIHAGRLAPDPLNVNSAAFQAEFDSASINNDNSDISPPITDLTLVHPGGNVSLTGKTGGSVYYLETVDLSNSDVIMMDTANGPVTLYLRGTFFAKDNSGIQILNSSESKGATIKITEDPLNPVPVHQIIVGLFNSSGLNKSGLPTRFTLMTDSDGVLEIKDSSEINGLLYAPHAEIFLHASKPFKGAILGKNIVCHDYSILYFDTALKDKYLSNDLAVISWEKVLN